MDRPVEPVNPCNLPEVNRQLEVWAAGREPIRPVNIERVVVEEDALDALLDAVHALGHGGPTLLVMDHTSMRRGTDDLKALIEDRLASAGPLTTRRLPAMGDRPEAGPFHADINAARQLAEEIGEYAAVVTVASGSITDVVKYARHLHGQRGAPEVGNRAAVPPMICFPTAASVTAYTSALAVLRVDGVKRTLPAQAPDTVVCDLRTLADAPPRMTLAGFGDVLARSVAYGDWYLAHELGMDDGFSEVPGQLLEGAEQTMIDRAERVAAGDSLGVRAVLDGLLLAGMAMSIVNQTAPVSGWEHVISHYLDLTADADRREAALHGAQVGVATLVAARAYERAWPELDPERILRDADPGAWRRIVQHEFSPLDPTGNMSAEIWRDLEKKLVRWNRSGAARRKFVESLHEGAHETFLRNRVRPSSEVASALRRATAPQRFGELTPSIPVARARAAVNHSHLIRARFTLGDLLSLDGWLTDKTAAALLIDAPVS
ncbi:MAG: sn-glycerol-1-phosphate dehydrogenase [bacterium]|nr:sn-glycerol-1-phosphate dehydrogenase [bacterium]